MKRKRGGSRTVTAEPANRSPAQEAGVVLQAPREESSGGSGGRDAIKATLTLECVDAYVKYRSFDVIGYGAYRKYVNAGLCEFCVFPPIRACIFVFCVL